MSSGHVSGTDETLDASPDTWGASAACSHAPVALVKGSGPHLTCETENVLQARLRIAALVMFGGFGVFLIYSTFLGQRFTAPQQWMFYAHIGITFFMAACSVMLCRKCQRSGRALRLFELVVFGVPVVFFVFSQWFEGKFVAKEFGFVPDPTAFWIMMIFIYAVFIPNTWQRAALIIAPLAAGPIVLLSALWAFDAKVAEIFGRTPGAEHLVGLALTMAICGVIGVIGVRTIGTLREKAFEAKQLGQYRLLKLLGAGGMGEVYLAEHQLLKRPCAIKLIHPGKAGDPRVLARFEREVRASAKLSHWNNIDIYDYGHAECGTFYYVMEYLPGLSLLELVRCHGPLEPARVVHFLRQLCDALAEAHAAGLIHRDIKPGNIFAAQRGGLYDVTKLLDFGLVKPLSDIKSTQLTQEGSIAGSPLYMAPEQSTGDGGPDIRSDIYSLGGVAYFLLTGRPPFEGNKPIQVIVAHAAEPVVPPSEIQSGIPRDLEEIVLKCLAKSQDDRWQNVQELAAALATTEVADGWSRDDATRWWLSITKVEEESPVETAV